MKKNTMLTLGALAAVGYVLYKNGSLGGSGGYGYQGQGSLPGGVQNASYNYYGYGNGASTQMAGNRWGHGGRLSKR